MKSQSSIPFSQNTSILFSQLVDINWEIKIHKEENRENANYYSELLELEERYYEIEQLLIEDMGQEGFDHFISMGRKMFATK